MSLDAQEMLRLANEQAGVEPEVVKQEKTEVPTGDPLQKKTPEEERQEALKLLDEHEKKIEETAKLDEEPKQETPEEKIARLEKELEELQNKEPEVKENPLEQVEKKVAEADIDLQSLTDTYVTTGKLSEEQLKSLNDAGFNQDAIDAYIATKQTIAVKQADAMLDTIMEGGRDTYNKMADWMRETLSEEDIAKYDKGVNNPEHSEFYIKSMYSTYQASLGESTKSNEPRVLRGNPDTRPRTGDNIFRSDREVAEAMADPRYKSDPLYRHKVQQKLLRS